MEPAGPRPPAPPARAGLVVLAALLTEIVVIGAACNQWVAVRIARQIANSGNGSETANDFKATLLVFNWRFVPEHSDAGHRWLAQIFMIMALVAVSAILIGTLASGPARFGRVLAATWVSVVFATVVATYVRGLVNDANASATPRITRALFGVLGPNSFALTAGMILGLVAAVIAAAVAVRTAPMAVPEEAPEPGESSFFSPEAPPPYYGEQHIAPPWQDQYGAPAAPTTRLPEVESPPAQPAADSDQLTTRFPRPPDDDELGHV